MNQARTSDRPALRRAARVYAGFLAVSTAIILLVFHEPTLARLAGEPWQRRGYIYGHTSSLDVHAVVGFVLLGTVLTQMGAGLVSILRGTPRSGRLHQRLGPFLAKVLLPTFILATAVAIVDRAVRLPVEKAVLFEPFRAPVVVLLLMLLVLVAHFTRAAWVRVKQGDIGGHLDAVLMMFLVLTGIAQFRLNYSLSDLIWGYVPVTVPGMYAVSVVMVLGAGALAAALAGRLRAMRRDFAVVALVNALALVAVAPWVNFVKTQAQIDHSFEVIERTKAEKAALQAEGAAPAE